MDSGRSPYHYGRSPYHYAHYGTLVVFQINTPSTLQLVHHKRFIPSQILEMNTWITNHSNCSWPLMVVYEPSWTSVNHLLTILGQSIPTLIQWLSFMNQLSIIIRHLLSVFNQFFDWFLTTFQTIPATIKHSHSTKKQHQYSWTSIIISHSYYHHPSSMVNPTIHKPAGYQLHSFPTDVESAQLITPSMDQ